MLNYNSSSAMSSIVASRSFSDDSSCSSTSDAMDYWPSSPLELNSAATREHYRLHATLRHSPRRTYCATCWSGFDDFVVHESRENLLLFLLIVILILPASVCLEVVGVVLMIDSSVGTRHWIRGAALGLVALGIFLQCLSVYLLINVHKKYRKNRNHRRIFYSSNNVASDLTRHASSNRNQSEISYIHSKSMQPASASALGAVAQHLLPNNAVQVIL